MAVVPPSQWTQDYVPTVADWLSALTPPTIAQLLASNVLASQSVYPVVYPGIAYLDNVVGYNAMTSAQSSLNQVTAVAGYVRGQYAAAGQTGNSVALFGNGTAEVNNAAVWGINTLLQDNATRASGAGTGRMLLNEFDFNVTQTGTSVIGCSVGGNSLVQPMSSNGFVVNTLGAGIKWGGGFVTEDGVVTTALAIGANAASGANTPGQQNILSYFDNSGVKQSVIFNAASQGIGSPGGSFTIGGSAPTNLVVSAGNILMSSGKSLVVNGLPVVGGRVTGWLLPTGGSKTGSNFAASSVTLPQLAAVVAQLINDLYSGHGLIGA